MSKSAQVLAELSEIEQRDAPLQADAVVDWARANESSALHGCFEWDDSAAARLYRTRPAHE